MSLSLTLFGIGAALALFGFLTGVASPGHKGSVRVAHLMSSAMVLLVSAGAVLIAVALAVHLM